MEEPILINRCRYEERTLRSSYRRIMLPRLILMYFYNAIMIAGFIYYSIRFYPILPQVPPHIIVLLLFLLLLVLFCVYRTLRMVSSTVRLELRRVEEQFQVPYFDETSFFCEEEIVTDSTVRSDQRHLSYGSIQRIIRCRETIAILTKARRFSMLDPACFENGTEADFWELMKEKCPKAVPRKYRSV